MAVDLGDYVEQVKAQVNPPGVNLFPNALDDEWTQRLVGGFWDARIQGITSLDAFTVDEDGLITPQSGTADIPRDLIQLVIVWTAFRAAINQLNFLKSQLKVQAGPVVFETQQSATVLKEAVDAIKVEKGLILERLSDVGSVPVSIVDLVGQADQAALLGATEWVSSTGRGGGHRWGTSAR